MSRILKEGFIEQSTADAARNSTLKVIPREAVQIVKGEYFLEEVRRELTKRFGDKGLYRGGLSVRTTLNSEMQKIAEKTLRTGLIKYDQTRLQRPDYADPFAPQLAGCTASCCTSSWRGQMVAQMILRVEAKAATIGLISGALGNTR